MKSSTTKLTSSLAVFLLLAAAQIASAFYDPSLGRWLTRDPVAERGHMILSAHELNGSMDLNSNRFVNNAPVNQVDPQGLLAGWGYGNWCGYDRYGQNGEPIDQVDNACKDHDNCIPTVWSFLTPCRAKICNQLFCVQVAAADCTSSPNPEACRGAKRDILALCALLQAFFAPFGGFP